MPYDFKKLHNNIFLLHDEKSAFLFEPFINDCLTDKMNEFNI